MQVQGSFTLGGADTSEVVPADETPVPATPARSTGDRPGGAWSVGRVLAKPPVRKLARELGIDLSTLQPSGPDGVVTREDVEAAAGATGDTAASPAAADRVPTLVDRREPIKGVRKMMGQAMVQSAFTIPHVTEWITVDVTRTMKLVETLRADREFADVKVSPLLVLARAVCLAMRRTPEVNAVWDDAAQEVVYKAGVNLGIAAATPRGLVVPNVKGADAMPLVELARSLNELTATARQGRTQPAEMADGTFTITNVGVFGVDSGTPIINPGESAILAFGAVRKQPWVHKGRIRPRDITTLALSFDHRFIDGAKGSQFLADVAAILERPATALRF
jgi:pyruvate dehydrogenase E2 component (dihydrolipoamide acetyltransferase)